MFSSGGVINQLIISFGGSQQKFMTDPKWYRTMYVGSNIWQNYGFTSIIYLSALSSIDPQIYESASIDGANRWHNLIYITLPSIVPVIITMFIIDSTARTQKSW